MRSLCIHGHFYQPPREHPWLGVVEPEPSAAPHHDWNARITAECYAPNAAARLFDGHGRLRDLVDTYAWTSFNFGPTLLAWLAAHAPGVIAALRRADAASRARTGHGNAWAQAYGHPILPLSTPRDVRTQVLWGRRDFEHRFGRAPEGMWLPEMAVDLTTLAALADAGIGLTMLAPHQARRVRPIGAPARAWRAVDAGTLDTRRLYRCRLAGGGAVDVVFRDPVLSHDIPFGPLLTDGARLAASLRAALEDAPEDAMLTVAADGETYGHHHRFGEMALAFALRALAADPEITLVGPAAFRAQHPAAEEVELIEATSWSCPHGVERWRADCGCRVGGPDGWSQAWRAPLRAAIDWLRDEVARVFESAGGAVLRDPWGARDRYVDCVLEPGRTAAFLEAEAAGRLTRARTIEARQVLELARNALLMQTSCGWFFDELTRIEPVQILRYAARAIELAGFFGAPLEDGFCDRLVPARSNLPGGESGADLYRRAARAAAASPARVACSAAILSVLGADASVPGYEVTFSGPLPDGGRAGGTAAAPRPRSTPAAEAGPSPRRAAGAGGSCGVAAAVPPALPPVEVEARVAELATGAVSTVAVRVAVGDAADVSCYAGGMAFGIADLFGVQRERLFAWLGARAAEDVHSARRVALERDRVLVDRLVAEGDVLPPELARLVGREAAETMMDALAAGAPATELIAEACALRTRGMRLPGRWLGTRLSAALETALGGLPASAPDALRLLDLAEAAGARLDLTRAQVLVLSWWQASPPAVRAEAPVAALCARLRIVPEER